jgi:hypothetical protein
LEKESLKMTEREFSKAEIDAMGELMAVRIHPNNLATFPDPDATPELIAKVDEIKQRYGIRELRPGYWGEESEIPTDRDDKP